MTREEALQILDTIPTIGEQVDALEMAIKALEQEPKFIIKSDGTIEQIKNCNNCKYGYLSSICQKPNTEICGNSFSQWKSYKAVRELKSLPSVQPKEIYNKGWKDGAEATAYHVELCEEENPTIPLSVIEDIKAEIEEESRFCPLTEGLECALEIINKHIAERGSK